MPPPPSSSNLSPNPEPVAGALEDDRHISQTRQIAGAASDGEKRTSAPTPLPGKRPFSNTLVTAVAPPPEPTSDAEIEIDVAIETETAPEAAAVPEAATATGPATLPMPMGLPSDRPSAPGSQDNPARSRPPPLPKTRSNPGFPVPSIAALGAPPPIAAMSAPLPAQAAPRLMPVSAPTFGPRPTPPPQEPRALRDHPSGSMPIPLPPSPSAPERPSWPGSVAPPRDQPSWTGPIGAIIGGGDRASWTGNMPLPGAQAPAPGEEYAPGHVIAGKFRLTRVIGKGGMGSVWHAQSLTLDIDVAVKLIRRDKAAPAAAMRLVQEARAAARLNHPSIVRVFELGETQWGDPFIAMEFLHGESLDAILRRKGRLPCSTAVQTLLPVASALSEAHSKGVIHRDLKPENVFLVTGEHGSLTPKVVDFGIAKLTHSDLDRSVTLAGEVVGSPDYMSPEQARGDEHVGEATDVWAFSVVLFEAITGRRPFDGANYNQLIAAILTTPPPSAAAMGMCDPGFWSIIERGLAKDVAARWPTIKALATALASWACERGIEEDITGAQIARTWLAEKGGRRLLTVLPEKERIPKLSSTPGFEASPAHVPLPLPGQRTHPMPSPMPSPMGHPPRISAPSAPLLAHELPWRPSLARRLLVPITLVLLLGAGAIAAFIALDQEASPPVAEPASTTSPAVAPSQTPSAEPALTASAAPTTPAASSVRPLPTTKAPRPPPTTAPKVPKHINF